MSARNCFNLGSRVFVNGEAMSPHGSAAHGHSVADYGSNVFHLLLAEAVLKSRPKPKPSGPIHPFAEEEMWGGRGLR